MQAMFAAKQPSRFGESTAQSSNFYKIANYYKDSQIFIGEYLSNALMDLLGSVLHQIHHNYHMYAWWDSSFADQDIEPSGQSNRLLIDYQLADLHFTASPIRGSSMKGFRVP